MNCPTSPNYYLDIISKKGFSFCFSINIGTTYYPIVSFDIIKVTTETGFATILVKGADGIYEETFDVFRHEMFAIDDLEIVGDPVTFEKQENGDYNIIKVDSPNDTYEMDSGSNNYVYLERDLPDDVKLIKNSTAFLLQQTGRKTFNLLLKENTSIGLSLGDIDEFGDYKIIFGKPSNLHLVYLSLGKITNEEAIILSDIVINPQDLFRDLNNRNNIIKGQTC